MNPITTGLHRPPYKRETPPGVYVIRRKLEAMPFLRDGSIEPGGFAPWPAVFPEELPAWSTGKLSGLRCFGV